MMRIFHFPTKRMLSLGLMALGLFWLGTIGLAQPNVPTGPEKILVSIDAGDALPNDTLYSINPDGSGQAKLFDFQNHPKDTSSGIWDVRLGADGHQVYFSSDNAYLYTPASRNLFSVSSNGTNWDQITPGPNSGRWNQGCPCGTVTGIVRHSNGDPWSGRPVFLEGKDMVYSGADGHFRFNNVPTGARWVLAYRSLGDGVYDSQSITVNAGLTTDVSLTPYTDSRMSFTHPVPFGQRIYHKFLLNEIRWTTSDFAPPVSVYSTSGSCTGIPDIDGFDVASGSGRLAIADYQEGCGTNDTAHRGIYLTDKDGNNHRLLVDMMADPDWCGVQELFWSPDESKLAVKSCYKQQYQWYTYLVIFDAGTGTILGAVYFPQDYTLYNINLHGWSPDGRWLLYSAWLNDTSNSTLVKIAVNSSGAIDNQNYQFLLSNKDISSATWGNLSNSSARQLLYLPIIQR